VISVLKATSTEELIRLANATEFTLAASVWTQDLSDAHFVAKSLNAGVVWINGHHLNDPSSPWGGWGQSGLGQENGIASYEQNTRQRSVVVNLDRHPGKWFKDSHARYS
jgi:acyl-CoA reductase-like NAD-dependent aldehyde dehydrogenase